MVESLRKARQVDSETLKARLAKMEEGPDFDEDDPKAALAAMMARLATKPKESSKSPRSKSPRRKPVVMSQPKTKTYPYQYLTKAKLAQGFEIPREYCPCKITDYLMKNVEKHFKPKQVYTQSDWLVTQTETGQTPKRYKQGGPNITWMNPRAKRIVLFMIDQTIGEETAERFKVFNEAYFHGAEVEIVKPGSKIVMTRSRDGKALTTKNVPTDFLKAHKIDNRVNGGYVQYNASDINTALKEYKARDTFCILGITNQDLYPYDSWNFVFGLANLSDGTGVFSFIRHEVTFGQDPDIQSDYEPAEAQAIWFKRGCNTMVHEITHMFGVKHCIYYECTMNGSNGSFESDRREDTTLCPSCLIKL